MRIFRTQPGFSAAVVLALGLCLLLKVRAALGRTLTRADHGRPVVMIGHEYWKSLGGRADITEQVLMVEGQPHAIAGVLPAASSLRFDVMEGLRDAARGSSTGRNRFGQALVVVEVGLALMLLAGAGLTFKHLTRLENQQLGFRPEGVLRAMTDFPAAKYEEVERRIGGLAGVARVGVLAPQAFPFGGPGVRGRRFEIFGKPEMEARAEVYMANAAYLEAVGLPLVRGRWFTEADTAAREPVSVMSRVAAAIFVVAVLAAWVPARRASRIDPSEAVRVE
ncbi:MAG: hypothetical protein FJW20_13315 [Acidimicrobiia bacterium]|nr:hypothetical protein [Acidimicrobiia bacterium]